MRQYKGATCEIWPHAAFCMSMHDNLDMQMVVINYDNLDMQMVVINLLCSTIVK